MTHDIWGRFFELEPHILIVRVVLFFNTIYIPGQYRGEERSVRDPFWLLRLWRRNAFSTGSTKIRTINVGGQPPTLVSCRQLLYTVPSRNV